MNNLRRWVPGSCLAQACTALELVGSTWLQLEEGGSATPFSLKDLKVRDAISIPTAPTKSLQIVGFFTLLVLKMMRCPQLGDKRMVRDVGKSCVHAVDDTTIRSPRSLFLSGLNYG